MGLFFSTKDIFGKFVEFNLLKGGAECSACEVNSMIKKRVRTMSFQPRKHSGMQQLYHIGYTYGVNLLLTFLYHFCDLGKTYYRGSPTYKKIINTVFATTVLSLCTYVQVGDFCISRGSPTIPLTKISCITVFSRYQNLRKGTLCIFVLLI